MASNDPLEQEFPTGTLRGFMQDWAAAGRQTFTVSELLRYLDVDRDFYSAKILAERGLMALPEHRSDRPTGELLDELREDRIENE